MAYGSQTGNQPAFEMAYNTLDAMAAGGIYDHIGFGFSRYSTDDRWLVPHFEKMLYDNALLAIAYLEGYQLTNKELYRQRAEQIFTYVLRDMTDEEGGFYSAEDADSEGIEGKFYVWSPDEVVNIVGAERGDRYCAVYDITDEGNFEGHSIPNLIDTDLPALAVQWGMTIEALTAELESSRQMLFAERDERIHPHKDDKILASWNGLMIAALAKGAKVTGDSRYAEAAARAADFVLKHMVRNDGRLLARYRQGEAAYEGYIDDYAFLLWGLTELYEANGQPHYLDAAVSLADRMLELFEDEKGGFFFTGKDAEALLVRLKETYDGATPSGNSVAAKQLLRLWQLTGFERYRTAAERTLEATAGAASRYPSGHSILMLAGLHAHSGGQEIVIAGDPDSKEASAMLNAVRRAYLPFSVLHVVPDNEQGETMYGKWEPLADKRPVNGQAAAYVCRNFACSAPVTETDSMMRQLIKGINS
jgi:uncharacterized protein YyaL (SSP411 family)